MSFQTMQSIINAVLVVVAVGVVILFLTMPVWVIVTVRQVAARRQRNHRDRWARQRVLERAMSSGVAASSHTDDAPVLDAYPTPAESAGNDGITVDGAVSLADNVAPALNDYPTPVEPDAVDAPVPWQDGAEIYLPEML